MQVEYTLVKRKAKDEGDASRLRAMSEDVDMSFVMISECPVEEDVPHEAVVVAVDDGICVSSICGQDERKLYDDILLDELYPEERGTQEYDPLLEDEETCTRLKGGATEPRFGGDCLRLNVGQDCSIDLKWNKWIERDIVDDVTGEELLPELVRKANIEELLEVYRRGVWKEVPTQECWDTSVAGPISVRWVVTKKATRPIQM